MPDTQLAETPAAIGPALTPHDRSILMCIGTRRGRRLTDVAQSAAIMPTSMNVTVSDTLMTLSGLEHLGLASVHRGWWRRTPAGDEYLRALMRAPTRHDRQERLV